MSPILVVVLLGTVGQVWAQANVQATLARLSSGKVEDRRMAMQEFVNSLDTKGVKEYGNDLLPVILKGVEDADQEVRVQAFGAINMLAHAAVWSRDSKDSAVFGRKVKLDFSTEPKLHDYIARGLADEHKFIREASASALGMLYPASPQNEKLLLDRWSEEKVESVRHALFKGIAAGQFPSENATNALRGMLDDKNPTIRGKSSRVLARRKDSKTLAIIVDKLTKEEPPVRQQFLRAIGEFGPSALKFLPEIEAAAKAEKDPITKQSFEMTIRKIREPKKKP